MNGGELKPGEIGIAVVGVLDLVGGEEYAVVDVLDQGQLVTVMRDGGMLSTGRMPERCYLCQASPGKQILVPIPYLRRRRPPSWDDVRALCGWAPREEALA